jgi:Phosphotransferase enzyme family
MGIPVSDPFGAGSDPELPSVAPALDPAMAERELGQRLARALGDGRLRLRAIRVTRHKPGRRCMIEYDLAVRRAAGEEEELTAIGKVRVRRFGKSGFRLLDALWHAGFGADSADGVSVPEPLGTVSPFRMWLQRKVPGRLATGLLASPEGEALGRRVAEAAHKLHCAGVPPERRHTMDDEVRILKEALGRVAAAEPSLAERIERLADACARLGAAVPRVDPRGIHRDFYADQVIVDGDRVHLIDFDLYCEGDPALDIGNFLGHVTEQSLRTTGDPAALAEVESAIEERFLELSGPHRRPAVTAYATLTLARHVFLSTQLPGRRPHTEALLELCEERVGRLLSI